MDKDVSAGNDGEIGGQGRQGPDTAVDPPTPAQAHVAPARGELGPASDHYAAQLRETAGAVFLYTTMAGIFQQMDCYAFKSYRDRLVADCGDPADPIEVMMIEQVALAHMNIGRLWFKSAHAGSIEEARAYGGMATQLLAEFRRTSLALQTLRLTAGHAGGAAAGRALPGAAGAGPVAAPTSPAQKNPPDDELVSTEASDHGDGTVPFPAEGPEAGGRRAPERAEAPRAIA
jgi:hypothetical protein